MKVALYGDEKRQLEKSKGQLQQSFQKIGKKISVDCYVEPKLLKHRMQEYDVIFLSRDLVENFNTYIDNINKRRVTFTSGKIIQTCYIDDILYIEADLKKVHIWTSTGEITLVMSISEVERLLMHEGFIKTHRSYLVNCIHICSIHMDEIILDNEQKIPVSKYRIKCVKEQYLNWTNS